MAFEFADQLRSQIDIVGVVNEYVRLKKAGTRWVAPCPFHSERTPSFGVNPVMQIFKCFGCGKGGNAITFVMEIEGISFWEACKQLAERHGIPLPKRHSHADEAARKRAGIQEMHELAQKLFRDNLLSPAGAGARAYLERRRVPAAVAEEFGLGLSERSGQSLTRTLQQAGFDAAAMEASGLVSLRQDGSGMFDRFRGRLMFPIHNETGKIIGFGGRALADGDEPKYLNSPETELYRKSTVLYNMHRARKRIREQDHALLVEGYMDVIGLHGAGVSHSVASCGTALGPGQIRIVRRHSEQIVVNFDPDTAGANAAERSIQVLLEEGMRVKVLALPGDLDPDEFIHEHGAQTYQDLLARAPRYVEWLAERARQRYDFRSAEGRVDGFKFLLGAIKWLPPLERAATADDLAHFLRVDKAIVLDQFRRAFGAEREQAAPVSSPGIPASERLLVRCLLGSPEARQAVLPSFAGTETAASLSVGPILAAMAAAGEPLDYGAVEGRLGEKERTLLVTIAFADEGGKGEEDLGAAQAVECVRSLEARGLESSYQELKRQIAEAERQGKLEDAIALSSRLASLGGATRRRRAPSVE